MGELVCSRLATGLVLSRYQWPVLGAKIEDLHKQAAAMLMSHYDSNERAFWPKKQFFQKAPEEVYIQDEDSSVLARYDIRDEIAASRRSLISKLF